MQGVTRSQILIVDDSLSNIELLANLLGGHYQVRFAQSGNEALKLVALAAPDLILLDVMMPGIDGFSVCRTLKGNAKTCDIPIIFLTSLESAVDEEFGLSLGAEDFIHKPISPPVVLARVKTHLSLAQARGELKAHNEHLSLLVAERTREIVHRDEQLIAAQTATITAFCALAETRDNETGYHIRRTQHYVKILAEELQRHSGYEKRLTDDVIQLLFKAAPLHDIGKVAIPDSILLKPAMLNEAEREIMNRHCVAGYNAIMAAAEQLEEGDSAFLQCAAEIAYAHHERWDGAGYPRKVAGDEIPLGARLMSVADVYDALVSRRVYKAPCSHKDSVELIVSERGTRFDPAILDAFVRAEPRLLEVAERFKDVCEGAAGDLGAKDGGDEQIVQEGIKSSKLFAVTGGRI